MNHRGAEAQRKTIGNSGYGALSAESISVPLCLCGLLLAVLLWSGVALAQSATPAAETGTERAPVVVSGRTLFELSSTPNQKAAQRAEIVNRRLERLIEGDEPLERFSPKDIITSGGQPLITLGGEPILTITEQDVADTLTPANELALLWGKKLSREVRAARIANSNPLSNAAILLLRSFYDLAKSIIAWLPRLLGVLLLALCFWPLARLARTLARKAAKRSHADPNLTQLALAIAFYGMWGLGLLAMLSAVGINSAGIAAAVGASGFVLAFAFQDVLSHFFAGMLLLMSRQFYIGSQIVVGEYEGIVERIDLRALYLRTVDNRQITIPNGQVFNSAVVVNTSNLWRRREFEVGIGYDADARQAMRLAREALARVEGVLAEPAPEVVVSQLDPSAVKLRLFFYTGTSNTNWLSTLSECILHVKEAFDEAGIGLAVNAGFKSWTIVAADMAKHAAEEAAAKEAAAKEADKAATPS